MAASTKWPGNMYVSGNRAERTQMAEAGAGGAPVMYLSPCVFSLLALEPDEFREARLHTWRVLLEPPWSFRSL